MTAHQGFRASYTTTGRVTPGFEHLRKNYVYGGSQPLEDDPGRRVPASGQGSWAAESRAERLRRYGEAREAGQDRAQAAALIGVSRHTGRDYERDYQAARKASHDWQPDPGDPEGRGPDGMRCYRCGVTEAEQQREAVTCRA